MWNISDMKQRGWSWLRSLYGAAYAACFFAVAAELIWNRELNPFLAMLPKNDLAQYTSYLPFLQKLFLFVGFSVLTLLWGFAGLFVKYLLLNPLEVGLCRYFLKIREEGVHTGFGAMASVFSGKTYWNLVRILFLRDLYLFFWTLLLVVPAIYKSYEYHMIPYLLAEHPQLTAKEAFAASRARMDGNRMQAFSLDLSFLGWNFLATLAGSLLSSALELLPLSGGMTVWLGAWIGAAASLLVVPYEKAAWTELYLELQRQTYGSGCA